MSYLIAVRAIHGPYGNWKENDPIPPGAVPVKILRQWMSGDKPIVVEMDEIPTFAPKAAIKGGKKKAAGKAAKTFRDEDPDDDNELPPGFPGRLLNPPSLDEDAAETEGEGEAEETEGEDKDGLPKSGGRKGRK